jgi:transcriptional regulator with XRE-family HTH domain
MQFAKQLRAWRGTLTQEQAATKLGVGLRTYQDWEQGRHTPRGLALNLITEKISEREKGREASRSKSNQKTKGKPPASGPGKKRVTNAKSKSR